MTDAREHEEKTATPSQHQHQIATITSSSNDELHFVPVEQEPMHRQRWKSDSVRLVCVQFPPHTTCLWHQHLKYGVYICIQDLNASEQPRGSDARALVKSKGDIFCRDHTEDKLIHVVEAHDAPLFIIEVELLKEKHLLTAHDDVAQHVARGVQCVNDSLECRVYRLELLTLDTEEIALVLPTAAVLVALDECVVTIFNPAQDSDVLADEKHLEPGDDISLVPGQFEIKLVARDHPESVSFVLTEVF